MSRARALFNEYPRQFWVLVFGLLVNSIAGGMIWPFLTLIVREQLQAPLTTVTMMFTVNSAMGVLATSVAGPAVDRFGRRRAMLIGLGGLAAVMVGMTQATTAVAWTLLMAVQGVLGPLYRIGADAMVADLTRPEQRAGAYAILRMGNNAGISIGPALGGFIIAISSDLPFYIGAVVYLFFIALVSSFLRETLKLGSGPSKEAAPRASGYGPVLRDRRYLAFVAAFTVTTIPSGILMTLLAVYAKEQFAVPESQYGFIMATNALMVVLFQVAVTRMSSRYAYLPVMAVGALLYAIGAGSVALGHGFWAFWTSMVILTVGELLLAPTGSAFTANLAPADMRGRYMGLYGLTWSIAFGIGPLLAGWLSDHVTTRGPWLLSLFAGLLGAAAFALLSRRVKLRPPANAAALASEAVREV